MVKFKTAVFVIGTIALSVWADKAADLQSGQQNAPPPPATPIIALGDPVDNSLRPQGSTMIKLPESKLLTSLGTWQQWLQGGSKVAGVNGVTFVNDPLNTSATTQYYVQFSRSQGGNDGGGAGVYKNGLSITGLAKDGVATIANIRVSLTGQVVAQKGGNIGNCKPQWYPEAAVQVRLKYLALDNQPKEWVHGFYCGDVAGADDVNFSKVPANAWFKYYSPNLKNLPGGVSKITEIWVYGFGWEFTGRVSHVSLLCY